MVNLAETNVGPEAKLKAEFVNNKIKLTAVYDGKGVDVEVSVSIDPSYLIDAVADKIPGEVDNAVFAMLKGAFLK